MDTKTRILDMLSENAGGFLSGESLAEELGISRAAVSKACKALRSQGYEIEARTNSGYMLKEKADVLAEEGASAEISFPCDITILDETGSTNEVAKEMPLNDTPRLVISNKQTSGKGRLGRRFESPAGTGLYMTLAIRPDFDIERSLFITMMASVAVERAVKSMLGIDLGIKWVNDLFLDGKKVCGILTEAQSDLESGHIDRLVIGIGVNCFPGSFPEELAGIAGPLSEEGASFSRSRLAGIITNELLSLITGIGDPVKHASFMDEYRRSCFILGREILVHRTYSDSGVKARAKEVADDGGLLVEFLEGENTGTEEVLHTGEISISL